MRSALLLAALALLAPPCLAAQQAQPGLDAVSCYRFDKPYFGYPPASTAILALLPTRHPEPNLGSQGRVVELPTLRPDSAARATRQLYSGWAPLRRDSVIIVWRNGLAGHRMRLAVRNDSLVGIGRFLMDDRVGAVRPGRVRAVRIDCPAA